MSDAEEPEASITDEELLNRDAKPWKKLIDGALRAYEDYQLRSTNIEKQYASLARLAGERVDREFSMFFANMQVVKPAVYARPPQPVVATRFNERKPVTRKAAEMLERGVIANFEKQDSHETLKLVRDDMVISGRGALWPILSEYETPEGVHECVRWDWLHRRDFLNDPARCWAEVEWLARRSWLSEKKGKKRFKDRWKSIEYQGKSSKNDDDRDDPNAGKAPVWEIWHKTLNLVAWYHPNSKELLDLRRPHLQLEGFFPCPRPAYDTVEPGTLLPVPDFLQYKDQLEEINELTARISGLSEALRMKGFYSQGLEDVGDAVERALEDTSNTSVLVGVPSTAIGNTSLKDSIVWLPVQEVAQTVMNLVGLRKQLIEDVYQISGISDIMRGDTAASETLGAQQLKSQYGSIRIRQRQEEMVRIANDALVITGEIMAENFSTQTLVSMSNMHDLPTDAQVAERANQMIVAKRSQIIQQAQGAGQPVSPDALAKMDQTLAAEGAAMVQEVVTVEKVVRLLQSQRMRPFVLNVSTESTIQPDELAEKKARAEFTQAFGVALQQFGPMLSNPATVSFAGEMIKFVLQPYRVGRDMESAIDDMIENAQKQAQAGQEQQQPDPEAIKLQAEQKKQEREDARFQMELKDKEAERQHERFMREADRKLKELDIQKAGIEYQESAVEAQQPANGVMS